MIWKRLVMRLRTFFGVLGDVGGYDRGDAAHPEAGGGAGA
jgi:hypothetical protein